MNTSLVLRKCIIASVSLLYTLNSFATDFYVKTTADGLNISSLRDAIENANASPGADVILFDPALNGTIMLSSNLPKITEDLVINGYSAAGASLGPINSRQITINIDGNNTADYGFFVASSNVTISGLAIYGCTKDGIYVGVDATRLFIWGCYIGTDNTGSKQGVGNKFNGINVNEFATGRSAAVTIGTNGDKVDDDVEGNLISGNGQDGILFWGTNRSIVAGNYIGTDLNGKSSGLSNQRNGIFISSDARENNIGTNGDGSSDREELNLITDNKEDGIRMAISNGNIIAGNIIGLDINGAPIGNGGNGIVLISSTTNRIGTNADGKSDAEERNIISANLGDGIRISAYNYAGTLEPSNDNIIAGNFIGIDNNSSPAGNAQNGISLNAFDGLNVSNNVIGSNGDDVADDIEANTIAQNQQNGIVATNDPLITNNRFSKNTIYGNGGLGIDLGNGNVISNDEGDGDAGTNTQLNFPVLTEAQISGSNLTITGFSGPNTTIEFYLADAGPNPNPLPGGFTKSFGEGASFLFTAQEGATSGIVDNDNTVGTYNGAEEGTAFSGTIKENKFSFTVPIPAGVTTSTFLTALCHDAAVGTANTSSFSGTLLPYILLPLRITNYAGYLKNNAVTITWETSDEQGNSHFDIERSNTEYKYRSIGTVLSKKGNQNNSYIFVDNNPNAVNFYRLKQVDANGKITYTSTLLIKTQSNPNTINVAPNFFNSFINISIPATTAAQIKIELYNESGVLIKQQHHRLQVGTNTIHWNNLNALPSGSYWLRASGSNVQATKAVFKK
jgi:parallel beta-helix repeat protein